MSDDKTTADSITININGGRNYVTLDPRTPSAENIDALFKSLPAEIQQRITRNSQVLDNLTALEVIETPKGVNLIEKYLEFVSGETINEAAKPAVEKFAATKLGRFIKTKFEEGTEKLKDSSTTLSIAAFAAEIAGAVKDGVMAPVNGAYNLLTLDTFEGDIIDLPNAKAIATIREAIRYEVEQKAKKASSTNSDGLQGWINFGEAGVIWGQSFIAPIIHATLKPLADFVITGIKKALPANWAWAHEFCDSIINTVNSWAGNNPKRISFEEAKRQAIANDRDADVEKEVADRLGKLTTIAGISGTELQNILHVLNGGQAITAVKGGQVQKLNENVNGSPSPDITAENVVDPNTGKPMIRQTSLGLAQDKVMEVVQNPLTGTVAAVTAAAVVAKTAQGAAEGVWNGYVNRPNIRVADYQSKIDAAEEAHKAAQAETAQALASKKSAARIGKLTAAEAAAQITLDETKAKYQPLIDAETARYNARAAGGVSGWLDGKTVDWNTEEHARSGQWLKPSTWNVGTLNPFTWPRRMARAVTGLVVGSGESTIHTIGQSAGSFSDGQTQVLHRPIHDALAQYEKLDNQAQAAQAAGQTTRAALLAAKAEAASLKADKLLQAMPDGLDPVHVKPGVFNALARFAGRSSQNVIEVANVGLKPLAAAASYPPVANATSALLPDVQPTAPTSTTSPGNWWTKIKAGGNYGMAAGGGVLSMFGAWNAHTSETAKQDRAAEGLRGDAGTAKLIAADAGVVATVVTLLSKSQALIRAGSGLLAPLGAAVGASEFLAAREAGDNERASGAAGSALGGLVAGAGFTATAASVTANPVVIGVAAVVGGVGGAIAGEKVAKAKAEEVMMFHDSAVNVASGYMQSTASAWNWAFGPGPKTQLVTAMHGLTEGQVARFKALGLAVESDGYVKHEAMFTFLKERGYDISMKDLDKETNGRLDSYDLYLILKEIESKQKETAMTANQTNAQAAVAALSANGGFGSRMAVVGASTAELGAVIPTSDVPTGTGNGTRTSGQDSVTAAFFA